MALRLYRAPSGRTYQYEEGKQPKGYEPVERTKPTPKRRATATKRREAQDK